MATLLHLPSLASPEAELDAVFAALADPTRRAIVSRLLNGDCTVSDLAAPFEMSLAAVSKHIAILTKAGLLDQRKEGRVKWCTLNESAIRPASVWMAAFGGFSEEDLQRIEAGLVDLGVLADSQEDRIEDD